MNSKLVELLDCEFAAWDVAKTTNESGLIPLDTKVVVKLTPVTKKIGSIVVPDEARERQQLAQIDAEIIALGPMAFMEGRNDDGTPIPWLDPVPKVGDRVRVTRYAGQDTRTPQDLLKDTASDEPQYRIVNHTDICAIVVS